jgi:hypothetical protein
MAALVSQDRFLNFVRLKFVGNGADKFRVVFKASVRRFVGVGIIKIGFVSFQCPNENPIENIGVFSRTSFCTNRTAVGIVADLLQRSDNSM